MKTYPVPQGVEHHRVQADNEEKWEEVTEDEEAGLEEDSAVYNVCKQPVYLEDEIVGLAGVEHALELEFSQN